VNGDTHRRVRNARVRIGPHAARTNARGVAPIRIRRRAPLIVDVAARGYTQRSVRMPFHRRRKVTIRIYDPDLQWRMYGADLRRTQAHTDIHLRPPFRVVWSRGLGSLVEFPAVVSDGVAYVGNYRGTIYALDMATGRYVWKYDPPGGKMASSPAVVDSRRLVVHGMDGVVRVLDRRNGRLLSQKRIGSAIESSPVLRAGIDYFGAHDGRLYALDLRTGRLRWTRALGYKITSSAAISGRTLFIGDYGGRVLALDVRTGRTRWVRSVGGRIYGTPAVAARRVFVPSSTGGSLTAFTTSGRYLWRVRTGSYVYSSPAVWAGKVFFGSYDGRLYAHSLTNGRRLWSVGAGGPISGAVVVVGGVAYAGSTWGRITGADARTGRVLLRFPHGEYVPVSGNGRRLLLHGYSRIYAVEPVNVAR
jgi:outer membrane protein assembly factor BamB